MLKYHRLQIEPFASVVSMDRPTLADFVHLDDSAMRVMLDYQQVPPRLIAGSDSVDLAWHEMQVHELPFLLVHDQAQQIIGIIGSEDILGEQPVKMVQQRRIKRDQLLVNGLMLSLKQIPMISIPTLEHAKVGHIIETLKAYHRHYAIVVEPKDAGCARLRGVFCASQIGRQLHQNISYMISNHRKF